MADLALEAVVGEVLTAVRAAGVDVTGVERLRGLFAADESALRAPLAEFGVDSLTWMAVLTALEERFDVLFPDRVATRPDAYTVLGLSQALSECLAGTKSIPETELRSAMRLVSEGERFRVIDDFLDPEELREIRQLMRERQFDEVPSVVYPETDGSAFKSRGAVLRHDAESAVDDPADTERLPGAYRALVREVHTHADMFGAPGEDWGVIGFSFWRYPAGSRLGWHNDVADGRQGEFILFLHEQWRASWAGELLLLDADPDSIETSDSEGSALEVVEAKVSQAPHCLTAIVPKPNRLVLVKEGTIHCIQRVDASAKTTMRQTMTGFIASATRTTQRHEGSNLDRLTSLLGRQ